MSRITRAKTHLASRPLFYVPLAVGIVFMFLMILRYGVNTPFYDQWEMVPLFQKVGNHTLGFSDLWHQHNEHRIFFPLTVALISAYITHWQTGAEVLIGFCCAAISATLLFLMLRKSVKGSMSVVAGALIAAWFFSPIQWENWLWGWQLEWFMCVLFVVATIFLLMKFIDATQAKSRKMLFGAAVISAFIATFSLAGGLFAWLLGIFILALGKQSRKVISVWTAAALLTIGLNYYHYSQTPTPSGPAMTVFTHHIFLFVEFFVAFIGGIAGANKGNLQTPDLVGAMLLLCLVPLLWVMWTRRRDNLKPYLPWLALILYGLLCGLSTAFGRLGYGIGFALSSRYTALSLLYVIGIIGLTFTLLSETGKLNAHFRSVCAVSIVSLSLPIVVSSYVIGVQGFQAQSRLFRQIKSCTHQQNPTDACLIATYPSPDVVRPRLNYIKAKHWAGY